MLQALIRAHSLALLIAQLDTGLTAEHLPMQLLRGADGLWQLRGHMARANALWRQLKLPDTGGAEQSNQHRSAAQSRWSAAHGKAG